MANARPWCKLQGNYQGEGNPSDGGNEDELPLRVGAKDAEVIKGCSLYKTEDKVLLLNRRANSAQSTIDGEREPEGR